MENYKVIEENFLDLLMYKFYTQGNIVSDKEEEQVRRKFKIQLKWAIKKGYLKSIIK